MKVNSASLKMRALAAISSAQQSAKPGRPQLDLIALALQGKSIGFKKVMAMIDDMFEVLKKEQADDESKKHYCAKEFDTTDDKKKGLEQSIADSESTIADAEESIASLATEIKAIEDGIKALDASVADATELRKTEHAEFSELMAEDSSAKDLLLFAKNRLNQFYNPKLYKPP